MVLIRLLRLTAGFHRESCSVSLSALVNSTGLVHNTVLKAIGGLEAKKFIEVLQRGRIDKSNEYRVTLPTAKNEGVAKTEAPAPFAKTTANNEHMKQSIKINKTTTVSSREVNVDVSPLASIGLTIQCLQKFAARQSDDSLQNSVDAFAFDLRTNRKGKSIKGSPLNFFIGILMKGPYTPPENFKSRQELAKLQEEEKLQEAEKERCRLKDEQLEKRKVVLRKIIDREFARWLNKLPEDKRKTILPALAYRSENIERACLRNHFEEQVLKISIDKMSEVQLASVFQNINQLIAPRDH